ncbi:hypothetical protein HK104_001832 [Borealophlyctis nickersoniae]|nr:hypothetical protein HK104_001832 [Borealophlyctis nickersoniae]
MLPARLPTAPHANWTDMTWINPLWGASTPRRRERKRKCSYLSDVVLKFSKDGMQSGKKPKPAETQELADDFVSLETESDAAFGDCARIKGPDGIIPRKRKKGDARSKEDVRTDAQTQMTYSHTSGIEVIDAPVIRVFTDGSYYGGATKRSDQGIAGIGVVFPDKEYPMSTARSAKEAEAEAVRVAVGTVAEGTNIYVYTDCLFLIVDVIAYHKGINVPAESVVNLHNFIEQRDGAVFWRWVKGHAYNEYNNQADELAKRASRERLELVSQKLGRPIIFSYNLRDLHLPPDQRPTPSSTLAEKLSQVPDLSQLRGETIRVEAEDGTFMDLFIDHDSQQTYVVSKKGPKWLLRRVSEGDDDPFRDEDTHTGEQTRIVLDYGKRKRREYISLDGGDDGGREECIVVSDDDEDDGHDGEDGDDETDGDSDESDSDESRDEEAEGCDDTERTDNDVRIGTGVVGGEVHDAVEEECIVISDDDEEPTTQLEEGELDDRTVSPPKLDDETGASTCL